MRTSNHFDFCRATYWAVHRGYCLWTILEQFGLADSIEHLYHAVLTIFENGFEYSQEHLERAKNECLAHGSLAALREIYPWHPSFKQDSSTPSHDLLNIDFDFSGSGSVTETIRPTQTANSKSSRHSTATSNLNSLQSTGEAQWKMASQQAEQKLENIRIDNARVMDNVVKKAKELSISESISYVDAVLRIQKEMLELQVDSEADSDDDGEGTGRRTRTASSNQLIPPSQMVEEPKKSPSESDEQDSARPEVDEPNLFISKVR